MPVLEQSPAHHYHHGHGHQAFYPQTSTTIESKTGKMQLTLILPNGVPSTLTVDANTPMMDLLVQAASLNKLNPSGYSLVVLDANQHVIHFKANQTVGQIGSSTISLLPKETHHSSSNAKNKSQPFEITVRLQVNLPDAQKILLRVDPTLPLHEIKEQICKQKKYAHSNEYTLRLPSKLDHPLLLGLSLAEYKTNELTLVHQKPTEFHPKSHAHHIQSFDRLYRARSESQPPRESPPEIPKEQQSAVNVRENSALTNNRSSTLRPSHTTLHAYWNDPNFDTQSQISNSSSTTKKRRAPRAPGHASPTRYERQFIYIQQQQQQPSLHTNSPSPPVRMDHHQSHDSLISENNRRKRPAPVIAPSNGIEKKEENGKLESQQQANNHTVIARPGLDPPPPPATKAVQEISHEEKVVEEPEKVDIKIDPVDTQGSTNLERSQPETTTSESPRIESHSTTSSPVEKNQSIEVQTIASIIPAEQRSEQKEIVTNNFPTASSMSVESNQIKAAVPKPPRQSVDKERKSSSVNGLLRIITDHTERAQIHQEKEKQQKENKESISYFRVAKSRCGKFETENDGFVFNSVPIFDGSAQQRQGNEEEKKTSSLSEVLPNSTSPKSMSSSAAQTSKGKQAYDLLKKYQTEENRSIHFTSLPANDNQEKHTGPIQLEVTERTTHITVTVESDRKQLITRLSPVSQEASPSPPLVAPKPFGKTVTEYRTVRRIGQSGETISSTDTKIQRSTPTDGTAAHESLMESIRRFGGSQNLNKK